MSLKGASAINAQITINSVDFGDEFYNGTDFTVDQIDDNISLIFPNVQIGDSFGSAIDIIETEAQSNYPIGGNWHEMSIDCSDLCYDGLSKWNFDESDQYVALGNTHRNTNLNNVYIGKVGLCIAYDVPYIDPSDPYLFLPEIIIGDLFNAFNMNVL
uniref:Uncharacterized protein n=1 Tax=Dulem virus 42 TaxID=3145760 RepID=A0AAU8B8H5_9CAUD